MQAQIEPFALLLFAGHRLDRVGVFALFTLVLTLSLLAYPVVAEKAKTDPWWSNTEGARLMVGEYVKYLVAMVRMHLDPDNG